MNTTLQHPDDLLAFYVNGTLSAAEMLEVETHITSCERCQNELTLLRNMREVSRQQDQTLPDAFAWQRLKRDIKQSSRVKHSSRRSWWQPGLGIAAAVLIVVQGVFIFDLKQSSDSYTQAGYQQSGLIVQVKINPQATEVQIRNLMLDLEAEIVAGPSARGLYRIKLSERKDDSTNNAKIQKLKESGELILYVAEE